MSYQKNNQIENKFWKMIMGDNFEEDWEDYVNAGWDENPLEGKEIYMPNN